MLRDGKVALAGQHVANLNVADVVTAIAGTQVGHQSRDTVVAGEPILTLEGLSGTRFGPVDLTVAAGEVVGLFGPLGSGRTELLETIFGSRRPDAGRILVGGRPINPNEPAAAIAEGMALVPADRLRQALLGELDAVDNVLLPSYRPLSLFGFRRLAAERQLFAGAAAETSFPTALAHRRGRQLSGGTQQKLIVGRWLKSARPIRVLMMDEPTQGVDAGTRSELYRIILDSARRDGRAVLFVSSDHEEVVALADRAVVMKEGRVVTEFPRSRLSEDNLLHAAHGDGTDQAERGRARQPGEIHA